jgi:hypothetical protein
MSIPPIPSSVLRYLRRFDLSSVAQSRDGRLAATRNPENYERAWWCKSVDVGRVIEYARRNGGDVPQAAAAIGVKLAPHDYVMQNTEQITSRLDARMRAAQASGGLREFNVRYSQYRRARLDAGTPAMGYSAARSRLRKALTEVAAGKAAPGIIARVFGGEK